jgi:hypothetical protein
VTWRPTNKEPSVTDQPLAQADPQPFVPAPPEPEPAPPVPPALPPAAPSGRARGRWSSLPWLNIALALAIAVAIGGIGFAAGRLTAPASALDAIRDGRQFVTGNGPNSNGGTFVGPGDGARAFLGGATIEGTVESIAGDTLTLKLANGSTIQVSLGDATTYHSQAAASSSDVTAGSSVIVRIQPDRQQGGNPGTLSAGDVTIVP